MRLPAQEKEVPVKTKVVAAKPAPTPPRPRKTHLDILEEELASVEAKLDALE